MCSSVDSHGVNIDHSVRQAQIDRQSCQAYYTLFRSRSRSVTVTDSPDKSVNKRTGCVVGFDTKKNQFIVNLSTRSVPVPTTYVGEKRFIDPGELELGGPQKPCPHQFPVVVTAFDNQQSLLHCSFQIKRATIDSLANSLDDSSLLNISQVRSYLFEHKVQPCTHVTGVPPTAEPTLIDNNKRPFQKLAIDSESKRMVMSQKKKKVRHAGPVTPKPNIPCDCCHPSVTCGECSDSPPIPSEGIDLGKQFEEQVGFDMDLIAMPQTVKMTLPFYTKHSDSPSASLFLNELNVAPMFGLTKTEDQLMHTFHHWPTTITNGDVYSLLPHNSISDSMIDLYLLWYVLVYICIKNPFHYSARLTSKKFVCTHIE